jgi:acetyl-CoA C-acetyltransferase
VVVAGGQESMTNAPFAIPDYRKGVRYGDQTLRDTMIYDALWDVSYDAHMGELTEGLVREEGITREQQDQYAVESNRRAAEAIDAGRYDAEIVPVETRDGVVERDEGPRPNTTLKRLGKLPPAFDEDGTIHAGNASKLSDGAGFVALTSDDGLGDRESLCGVTDVATAYRDPKDFNKALAAATEKLLEQNDLAVSDVDRFELNEAFAAQMVYVMDRVDVPREKLNPDGGAVAFGHPIGASGGMLPASLAYAMRRDGLSRAITGMSVGGGGGVVVLLER